MASPNSKRLIQNIVLLLLAGALIFFITTRKESKGVQYATLYDNSIGENAKEVIIHAEGRADILLKNEESIWKVVKPDAFIADKAKVQHLFTLLSENAESSYDINGKDLASYGLDKDRLSVSFNGVKMIFGKLNEVARKRYIRKGDKMYLIEETVSGLMEMGVEAFRPAAQQPQQPTASQAAPEFKSIAK